MSGNAKNIISLLPNLSPNELIEIQYLIELQLKNKSIDTWESNKLPQEVQEELSRRIALYEKGEIKAIPYKKALSSIRSRLNK